MTKTSTQSLSKSEKVRLTGSKARKTFKYDRHAGTLTWLDHPRKGWVDQPAPIIKIQDSSGKKTLIINYNRVQYKATDIIYLMLTDEYPNYYCKFKDDNACNLKWKNLDFSVPKQPRHIKSY